MAFNDKSKRAVDNKAWRLANPGHDSAARKATWREANPGREIVNRVANLEKRAGRPKPVACEVCGSDSCKICFDHNHRTGTFRGWLCQHCNLALGHLRDSQWRLLALVEYLNENEGAPCELQAA